MKHCICSSSSGWHATNLAEFELGKLANESSHCVLFGSPAHVCKHFELTASQSYEILFFWMLSTMLWPAQTVESRVKPPLISTMSDGFQATNEVFSPPPWMSIARPGSLYFMPPTTLGRRDSYLGLPRPLILSAAFGLPMSHLSI